MGSQRVCPCAFYTVGIKDTIKLIVDFRSKFAEVYTLTAVGQKILYRALQTLINVNFYLLNIFCRKVSWCFIECILAVFRNTCARPSECEFVGRRSKGTQFDTACFTNAVFQFEGSTSEINSIGVNGQINLTCIVFFFVDEDGTTRQFVGFIVNDRAQHLGILVGQCIFFVYQVTG